MPIISEIENFLLKFKQQPSDDSQKPVEVIVSKEDGKFLVEIKGDKKGSSIKISLTSLKEIVYYINEKTKFSNPTAIKPAYFNSVRNLPINSRNESALDVDVAFSNSQRNIKTSETSSTSQAHQNETISNFLLESGLNGASESEVISDSVGNINDLISDISAGQSKLYASQADLIISSGIRPNYEE